MERHSVAVLTVLLASSFLNAAYFVPIVYKAFFKKEETDAIDYRSGAQENNAGKEIPFMVVPLTLTAIVSILLGLYPDFIVKIAESVSR